MNNNRNRSQFRRVLPMILTGFVVILVSAFVAGFVASTPDEFVYTFDPDPIPVTGTIEPDAVPISGRQCFSSNQVYTVTSETWSYTLGPSAAPAGFRAFYTNAPATFEFRPGGRELNSQNCRVFVDQNQTPPEALTADLLDHCDATPQMEFRLNAQAIDVATGRTSEFVIRSSEPFTFPDRC